MSEWTLKCWGKTRDVYCTEYALKQELILKANTYCSVHYHSNRINRFILKAGKACVLIFSEGDVKCVELAIDEPFVIGTNIVHCFVVISDGVMEEEYYNEYGEKICKDDITRLCEGGHYKGSDLEDLKIALKLGIRDAR